MLLIVTLLFQYAASQETQFLFTRKSCCSGTAPTTPAPQLNAEHWQKTLREAAYQSIMRHTDFTGTLDDRLNRDHELWTKIKQARFKQQFQPYTYNTNEVQSGILIERKRRNGQYEFRQSDKRIYDCSDSMCKSNNTSLVALWRVRKTQDPYGLWIRVKLPHTHHERPIEDVYEYNVKYGLKHLNSKTEPNPITERLHQDKMMDRIDVRFPDDIHDFLRIKPIANHGNSKHYPTTSQRNLINYTPKEFAKQHADVGTVVATGPEGYRHIIHSLGKIPLAGIIQPIYDGFIPSIGPLHEPPHTVRYHPVYMNIPVYTTNNDFNPPFTDVYRQALNNFFGKKHTVSQVTQKQTSFKPSTEYIQYSEMDPLYHSTDETDTRTSPMPEIQLPLTSTFPDSVSAQLPPTAGDLQSGKTKNTTPRPRSRFQIIVSEYNKQSTLLTKDNNDNNDSHIQPEDESISEINEYFTPVYEIRKQTTKKYPLANKNDKQDKTTPAYAPTIKNVDSEQYLTTDSIKHGSTSPKIELASLQKDSTAIASEQTEVTTQSYDKTDPSLFATDILLNSTLDIIKNMKETAQNEDAFTTVTEKETTITDMNYETTNNDDKDTIATEVFTTIPTDDTATTDSNTDTTENNLQSFFSSLTETLFQPTIQPKMNSSNTASIFNSSNDGITELERVNRSPIYSQSPVTVVENRISQSITYKTSKGTTGSLTHNNTHNKSPAQTQHNSSWASPLHNFGLNSILSYLATPDVTPTNININNKNNNNISTNTKNQNPLP